MKKFIIGAAIGGVATYLIHRKAKKLMFRAGVASGEIVNNMGNLFGEPTVPASKKPNLHVVR